MVNRLAYPMAAIRVKDLPPGALFRYIDSSVDSLYMKTTEEKAVSLRDGTLFTPDNSNVVLVKEVSITAE